MAKSSKDARRELKDAREELERVARADRKAGHKEETDAYLAANQRVIDAEQRVPWWQRGI